MDQTQSEPRNKRVAGQRAHACKMTGCLERGRILGRMGETILLTYCPKHRKKGERILNFLVNSLMRYRLTRFLQDSKQALFMKNEPKLSAESYASLASFVNESMIELDEMEKLMLIEEVDTSMPEEFTEN